MSELPVEYPTRFELVVNVKTAKAIGRTIGTGIGSGGGGFDDDCAGGV